MLFNTYKKVFYESHRFSSAWTGPLRTLFLSTLLLLFALSGTGNAQDGSDFDLELSGYLKELAQISADNALERIRYDNTLHHRLESEWSVFGVLEARADMRTRLLNGYSVKNTSGLEDLHENDPGYLDLSWVWYGGDRSLLHSGIDRLHLSYYPGEFEFHAGRQRINWGRTYVWNPNDLFNQYAFLNFDYEERPGVDALNARYSWSYASGIEASYMPGHSYGSTAMAAMLRESLGNYDIQLIWGYYRRQVVAGGGWSGYMGDAGFKGEISWFHPEEELLERGGYVTATMGWDYMLPSGLYLQGELLYNGGYRPADTPLTELGRPPSADNLFIARSGWFLNGSRQLHPLLNAGMGVMGSFDRSLLILMPRLTYSLSDNLELLVLSQLLKGRVFSRSVETPNLFFVRLKFSY